MHLNGSFLSMVGSELFTKYICLNVLFKSYVTLAPVSAKYSGGFGKGIGSPLCW